MKAKSNISLKEHSVKVSELSLYMLNSFITTSNDKYQTILRYSTLLHDIGKCTKSFQSRLNKKKTKSNNHLHNEIGWAFVQHYLNLEQDLIDEIGYLIYWHHGIVKRRQNNTFSDDILSSLDNKEIEVMKREAVKILDEDLILEDPKEHRKKSPIFLEGLENTIEYERMFLRTIFISADRIVSEYSNMGITDLCEIYDKDNLKNGEYNFDKFPYKENPNGVKRFNLQNRIVKNCDKTTIVKAPGGFGKTLLGLLWSLKNNKKTIWVCPRNSVAKSVYNSILSEMKEFGTNINVELYLTGEVKQKNNDSDDFSSDIIVTNIDNFLKPSINSSFAKNLYLINTANVVFDEYHELVQTSALFPLFVYIMNIRHNYTNSNTILLSATPISIEYKWDTMANSTTVLPNKEEHFSPIHNKKYSLNIKEGLEGVDIEENKNLCIFNTVKNTQIKYSISKKNSSIIHGHFEEDDKDKLFTDVMTDYGKYSKKEQSRNVVSSTIIQASLDVSFNNLYESILSPESTLQRIARVNRWGENKNANLFLFDLNDRSENMIKNELYSKDLRKKWITYLKKYDGKNLTLKQFYTIYNSFSEVYKKEIREYIRGTYNKALKRFPDIYPTKYFGNKDDGNFKASGNKLRSSGNEIFFICRRHKTAKKGSKIEYTNPFSIEVRYNLGDMFKETRDSLKRIKDTMYKLKDDERYDYGEIIKRDRAKNVNSEHIRHYAKFYKTPYIRRDVVYHKEYGVIDKENLKVLNL